MHNLKDKTAIVTGASRGVGTYIAQALAQERMKLVLAARTVPELEEVAQRLRQEGHQVLAVPTDVTDPAALEALVEAARREFGTVDVLVNNAGGETLDAYHRLGWEEVYNTLQVNLTAPMHLTHLVLPGMLAQGRGHIVNISSLAARNAVTNQEPYCTSKAGLWGFTVALRASYRGSGVSASVICPGFIKGVGMFQRIQDATGVKTPFYGASPPEKVASAIVRAIKRDLPEVIVNPAPVRPFLALEALFPRLIERVIPPINWNPPSADFRGPGYRARRRRLAGQLVRAAGSQEQAPLYGGHPAVGLAAVGQKLPRTGDPSVRGDRRTVQVRAGFCTTVARCCYLIPRQMAAPKRGNVMAAQQYQTFNHNSNRRF